MENAHTLILESEPAPGVLELRFNASRTGNAFSPNFTEQFIARLDSSAEVERFRAIIITGGPILFSVGADVSNLLPTNAGLEMYHRRFELYCRLAKCPKPLIAAVCGPALGGGFEIALAADMIIAGASARFGLPETNLGIMPAGGGTQRLVRAAGKALAMQMILAGRELSASEAKDAGVVSEVVPDPECLPRARAIAEAIAKRPPDAIRSAKQAVLASFEHPLERGLSLEQEHYVTLRGMKKIPDEHA
jgi:enoyl-CoA hydratase